MNPRKSPAAEETTAKSSHVAHILEVTAVSVVALFVIAAGARQISAVDYWWQLATGSYILENGWPKTDGFSWSVPDSPWIELRWLYCVVLNLVVGSAGPAAAIGLKILTIAGTLVIAVACSVTRRTIVPGAVLAAIAVLAMSNRLYVRPELVSGLMLLVYIAVVHHERTKGGRLSYALPVLQILWVNSHTLFILGPAVVGAWFTAEAVARFTGFGARSEGGPDLFRRSAVILTICVIACVLNPWMLEGALFPFTLFQQLQGTEYSSEIGELRAPFADGAWNLATTGYVALLVVGAAALAASLMRLDLFLALCAVAFGYLSLTAMRNIPLFVTAVIPLALVALRDTKWLWSEGLAKARLVLHHAAAGVLIVAALALSWQMVTDRYSKAENSRFGFDVNPYRHPTGAVAFLEENGVIGEKVFNYLNEGAYLLYRGYPVYFDPRLEVYGEDHLLEYRRVGGDAAAFLELEQKHDLRVVMLGIGSDQLGFLDRQEATDRWRLVYIDHQVFVLLREGVAPGVARIDFETEADAWLDRWRRVLPDLVKDSSAASERPPIGPYLRLGQALIRLGASELAAALLRDALVLDAGAFAAHDGLGRIALARKDYAAAVEHFRVALAKVAGQQAGNIERNYRVASGNQALQNKDYATALREFERANELRRDPALERVIEQLRKAPR